MGMYDNLLAQERQRVAQEAVDIPLGRGALYLAAEGGEQMRQGMRGMLGMEEPVIAEEQARMAQAQTLNNILTKFKGKTSRQDYQAAMNELIANGFLKEAEMVSKYIKELPKATEPKTYQDNYGATRYLNTGDTWQAGTLVPGETAQEAEKDSKGADAKVKDNILNDLIIKNDGDVTKASYDFKEMMDDAEARKYNPNAFPNIAKKLDLTNKELSPIKNDIKQTEKIILLLNEAQNGDTIAWNNAAREMAKLVGDSNISSLEVKTVTGGGSFPDRLVNNLSIWATGVPGDKKIDEALNVATVLAKALKDDYNEKVNKFTSLWADDMTNAKTISLIVGDKYVTKPTTNNYTPEELAAVIAAKEAELAKKQGN